MLDGEDVILVNGEPNDSVSALDRGLAYGDGVFETIALRDGGPEYWQRHCQRLGLGCGRLGFSAPDQDLLRRDVETLLIENEPVGIIKILVSRGCGGRGYAPPENPVPTRVVIAYPPPIYPAESAQQGVSLHLCTTALACNPALAGMKHLNRLEHVMARREWDDPRIAEGLMLNLRGEVIEGVMSNVFWVKNQRVHTPDLSLCGVAGIMRGRIVELLGEQGMNVVIRSAMPAELLDADEVFVCNSLIGIWPVQSLAGRRWPVGPITQQLRNRVEKDRACSSGYC